MSVTIFNQLKTNIDNSTLEPFIRAFTENCQQLQLFLKLEKSQKIGKQYLYDKPWLLLFGNNASGKTSIIKQAELDIKHSILPDNAYCSSYITNTAIYIDVKGDMISQTQFYDAWTQIAAILAKIRKKRPLSGVIFVLNLQEILSQTKLQREATLSDHLRTLQQGLSKSPAAIPIYFIVTHLDILQGFNDFFDDYIENQRKQPCGFMFPIGTTTKSLQNYVQKNLDQLIESLNKTVLRRLQQTRQNEKHKSIYQFPLQFEHAKSFIIDTVKWIFSYDNIEPHFYRGLFFCSNQQCAESNDDIISMAIHKTFELAIPQQRSQTTISRTYFIHDVLKNIIPDDSLHLGQKRHYSLIGKSMRMTAVIAASFVLFGVFTQQFIQQAKLIHLATSAIVQYDGIQQNAIRQTNLEPLLQAIQQLALADKAARGNHFSFINIFPFSSVDKVKAKLHFRYQQALRKELLPLLSHYIDKKLTTTQYTQAADAYVGLKTYLMLGFPEHMNAAYFTTWLQNAWKSDQAIGAEKAKRLADLLQPLLQDQLPSTELNPDTINEIRVILGALPKSFIAYLSIQQNHIHESNYPFSTEEEKALGLQHGRIAIPYLYTKTAFAAIYDNNIPEKSKMIYEGDWILGRAQPVLNESIDARRLTAELRQIYLKDYINWWSNFIANLRLQPNQEASDLAKTFHNLSSSHSVLSRALNLVKENTSFDPTNADSARMFNKTIVPHFVSFQLIQWNDHLLKQAMTALENDLLLINSRDDSNKAAFEIAARYFNSENNPISLLKKQSHLLPQALQGFIDPLTTEAWEFIQKKAEAHLNTEYLSTVYSEYHDNIEAKYPFRQDSEDDVTYFNFNHFFSPQGTMDTFFTTYLSPLLDTTTAAWHLKNIEGLQFQLSQDIISQFIRANLIKTMFFANSDQANLQFSLKPVNIDKKIKDIMINIYGQKSLSYLGSNKETLFTWPTNENNVSITLESEKGEKLIAEENGLWAWFKILEKSNLNPESDNKHYHLVFVLGENNAQFELSAESEINPFVPGIISEFSLPGQLLA